MSKIPNINILKVKRVEATPSTSSMTRHNKKIDFEIVPIARPPPPPAPQADQGAAAAEIFTVDLSNIQPNNQITDKSFVKESNKICPTCSENVEKARFLMNYLDQTDEVFHLKAQLEKERDQLNRLLEEKNTYIEALKKEEVNLNFKLVKMLEDRDQCQKQLIDLHKQSQELRKEKSLADIEAMGANSSKVQLQHLVDELRHDKKYLQEKLDEKSKLEMTGHPGVNVEKSPLNNKDMKRLLACLRKCLKISKKIKRYERKGQNRIPIKKFSKYLKKLNESAKFLTNSNTEFGILEISSSSESEDSELEENQESSNISKEPHENIKLTEKAPKKPTTTPQPKPTTTPQPKTTTTLRSKTTTTTLQPAQTQPKVATSAAAKKLQNAWQEANVAPPMTYQKPKEAILKEKKVFVTSAREDDNVEIDVFWPEIKRKIGFLRPKLSPMKEKVIPEKKKIDVEPDSNLENDDWALALNNSLQIDENPQEIQEKKKIDAELDSNLEYDESTLVIENSLQIDENPQVQENVVNDTQNDTQKIDVDAQENQPNTSLGFEENLMIDEQQQPEDKNATTSVVENSKFESTEKCEENLKTTAKRKKSKEDNREDTKIVKKRKISGEIPDAQATPICCLEPIPDKKCPARVRHHFLCVLDALLSKENSSVINLGGPKALIGRKFEAGRAVIGRKNDVIAGGPNSAHKGGGAKIDAGSKSDVTNAGKMTLGRKSDVVGVVGQQDGQILRAFKALEDKMDKFTPQIFVKCLLEQSIQKCWSSLVVKQWTKMGVLQMDNWPDDAPYLTVNERRIFELLDMLFKERSPWLKPTCNLMIEQLLTKIFDKQQQQNQQIFETYCRWFFYFARKISNFQILARFFHEMLFFTGGEDENDDYAATKNSCSTRLPKDSLLTSFLCLATVWPQGFLRCVFEEGCDNRDSDDDQKFFFEIFRHVLWKKLQTNKDSTFLTKTKSLLQHFCPQSSTIQNSEKFAYLFQFDDLRRQNSSLEYFEFGFKKNAKALNPYFVLGLELEEFVKLRNLEPNLDLAECQTSNDVYFCLKFSGNFCKILNNLCKFSTILSVKFVVDHLLNNLLGISVENSILRLIILGQMCKIPKFGGFFQSRDDDLSRLIGYLEKTPPTTPILRYAIRALTLQLSPICCKVRKICGEIFQEDQNFDTPELKFLRLFYEKMSTICKV